MIFKYIKAKCKLKKIIGILNNFKFYPNNDSEVYVLHS